MALAEGEVPECPGLTEEQLTQLKSLAVTEDIHDKVWRIPIQDMMVKRVCAVREIAAAGSVWT